MIDGEGFGGTVNVTIGTNQAASVQASGGTRITCVVPAALQAGQADVIVSSSTHGERTRFGEYTYNPSPTITNISPAEGSMTGGTVLTITGTGFGGTVNVTVGTAPAADVQASFESQVTCRTPASMVSGKVSVTINSSTNGAVTRADAFTYTVPPPQPSFGSPVAFTTGAFPTTLSVFDINADSRLDLSIANYNSRTLSILLNDAPAGSTVPSFRPGVEFTIPDNASANAPADINLDGKPDVMIVGLGAGSYSVFINETPDGGVTPTLSSRHDTSFLGLFVAPENLAMADFNRDSKPDAALVGGGASEVKLLLNTTPAGNPVPSFDSPVGLPADVQPVGIAAGDLNGDGAPDLVVGYFNLGKVSVIQNLTGVGEPTPSFDVRADLSTTDVGTERVTLGDLNGDGKLDIVAAVRTGGATVFLNTTASAGAARTFSSGQDFGAGFSPNNVALGDFDGNGRPDVVVSNFSSSNVSILMNTTLAGAPTASLAPKFDVPTDTFPAGLAVADVNSDGKPDLLVTSLTTNRVLVFLNTRP